MKIERMIDYTLTIATLIFVALCLVPLSAGATGTPPPTQQQAQQQKFDLSLANNPVANGMGGSVSSSGGNTYLFPPPAAAAPLPSGLCPQGDSESWSVIWGFVSYAKSSMRTEMECLDKLLAFARETAPKPQPAPVINYIQPSPAVVECKPKQVAKKPVKKQPLCAK